MMNYEIFKEVVKEKFMDYMPDSFKGMELIVRPAEKVNMTYDAINIRGEDTTISPTFYINDMYEKYQSCGDLEETLMAAGFSIYLNQSYAAMKPFKQRRRFFHAVYRRKDSDGMPCRTGCRYHFRLPRRHDSECIRRAVQL